MTAVKAIALAASLFVPSLAAAQDTDAILEARQGFMSLLSFNMGKLSGMAKGEIEYDAEAASVAASNIVALTNYDIWPLFVEGTSSEDLDNSDALPAIWENPDDFRAKFAALREAAAGAPATVGGGQEALGPALQQLGGACKSCHDDYRKDD
ncbi:cytochrome c [Paracoccus subflavus]|uniref:Cytochrome c n=1 Tax=Paracoccus subflavus TaxID=2528244 RepID=A0A4Q9G1U0_9RHOB|nr:cytochrome c [Paracoccus subflavus]TBN39371.1 cytochrome c [Paracoccus subflavus]